MKKIIYGIIIGVIISFSIQAFASEAITALRATFEVYVAGQKFVSDKPILSVDGSTYIPLKDVGKALGAEVNWNEEYRRVEIGMKSADVIPTPRPTPKPTDFIKTVEDEFVTIQLLGSKISNDEFPQKASDLSDIIALKIRIINKTGIEVPLRLDDFKGIYELKDPPESKPWVQSKINLNKGSKVFATPVIDPGFWKINLLTFKFDKLLPGEVREGVIVYNSIAWNRVWHGLKYKNYELKFDQFHSF